MFCLSPFIQRCMCVCVCVFSLNLTNAFSWFSKKILPTFFFLVIAQALLGILFHLPYVTIKFSKVSRIFFFSFFLSIFIFFLKKSFSKWLCKYQHFSSTSGCYHAHPHFILITFSMTCYKLLHQSQNGLWLQFKQWIPQQLELMCRYERNSIVCTKIFL